MSTTPPADDPEATLPPAAAPRGVPALSTDIMAAMATRRLCKICKHQERSLTLAPEYKLCLHPTMPLNLVTGTRKFPCVIARGYDQLCGYMGTKWEPRG